LTSKDARAAIESLKAMPDKPFDAAKKPEPKTDMEVRNGYLRRISEHISKIHALKASREFIAEHEGIEYLIDAESLGLLGLKEIKPLDELSLDELAAWGKWLSVQPGAAMPVAGKEVRS
jgi:hypothetical protein